MRAVLSLLAVAALAAVLYVSFQPAEPAPAGGPVSATGPASPAGSGAADPSPSTLTDVAAPPASARSVAIDRGTPDAGAAGAARVAEAAPRVSVTGRVLDPLGRPQRDADVGLARSPGLDGLVFLERARRDAARPEVLVTTGTDGRFSIELEPGEHRLRFGADGCETLERAVTVAAGGPNALGDVQLAAGIRLAGRVVDSRGNPVPRAEISRPRSGDGLVVIIGNEEQGEHLTETRADGTFEVARHPAGAWTLFVSHPAHPRAELSGGPLQVGERKDDLLVELADGVSLAGTVSGLPVGEHGLLVRARAARGADAVRLGGGARMAGIGDLMGGGGRSAEIRPDGSFEVTGLGSASSYQVGVYTRDGGPFGGGRRSPLVTAAAGARDVRLAHGPGASVAFRVVDAATKLPVETFAIEAGFDFPRPQVGPGGDVVGKYPGGVASVDQLWPDGDAAQLQLVIKAVGYAEWTRQDIDVRAGAAFDLGVIELAPVPVVEVRVTHAGGPIAGAAVVLTEEEQLAPAGSRSVNVERRVSRTVRAGADSDGDTSDRTFVTGGVGREEARTDEQGIARLNSFPGKLGLVTVTAKGFAEWQSTQLQLPERGVLPVEAQLTAGGVVAVTVVDRAGKPAAGVAVERRASAGAALDWGNPEGPHASRQRVTNGEGVARFDYVAAGRQGFRVVPKRQEGPVFVTIEGMESDDAGSWSELDVAEGGAHTLALALPAVAILSGTVYEDGRPLGGARVRRIEPGPMAELALLGGGGGGVATDGAGRFVLDGLEPGSVEIEVQHPSRVMPMRFTLELAEGENAERFELPVSIVTGKVTNLSGEPVADAVVSVSKDVSEARGDRPRVAVMITANVTSSGGDGDAVAIGGFGADAPEVRTDADGRYTLRGVTSDIDLVVTAEKKGYREAKSKSFVVGAGQTRSQVDLVLESGGKLRVTCAEGGMWVAMATFEGEGAVPGPPKVGMLRKGEYVFEDLTPGAWRVELRPAGPEEEGGEAFEPRAVDVKADATVDATFER